MIGPILPFESAADIRAARNNHRVALLPTINGRVDRIPAPTIHQAAAYFLSLPSAAA